MPDAERPAASAPGPFNEDRLRFDITTIWGEYGAHADLYDRLVKMASERFHIEAICVGGCQDCVSVERTFDPQYGWVWVVTDCSLDKPMQDHDIEVLRNSFLAARKAILDAHT